MSRIYSQIQKSNNKRMRSAVGFTNHHQGRGKGDARMYAYYRAEFQVVRRCQHLVTKLEMAIMDDLEVYAAITAHSQHRERTKKRLNKRLCDVPHILQTPTTNKMRKATACLPKYTALGTESASSVSFSFE
mmetsp:Transcript_41231/g.57989  ORF Transcript_41231/g.57989 Transcript_41231/m.57989 type:complete len:131 (+) Transcript_41231:1277-1669(+)